MQGHDIETGIDWARQRARFPVFGSKVYINSCSYGALSNEVEAAFHAYLTGRHANGSDWDNWVGHNEALRIDYAGLFGVSPAEIAVTPSASAGINSVASAMDFSGKRNKIVVTDLEFPTNAQIWYAQERRGAVVERVVADNGVDLLERLAAAIDETTRIVAVTHVCYRNGEKLDIAAIGQLARAAGAFFLVDGYQAAGTMAIDLASWGADFYVGGALKYLLGTAGIGYLYVRQGVQDEMHPTVTGWFAQEEIGAMDHTRHNPAHDARKFEGGTPPVANIYAARAGLGILAEIGLPAIEAQIAGLTERIIERARETGIVLATPAAAKRRGAMVALRCLDAGRLVDALSHDGIVTSWRDGNLRLSPHFYNTEEDIDRVFAALGRHPDLVGQQSGS